MQVWLSGFHNRGSDLTYFWEKIMLKMPEIVLIGAMTHILKRSCLSFPGKVSPVCAFSSDPTKLIFTMEGNLVFPLLLLFASTSTSSAQLPLPHLDPRSPLAPRHNEGLSSLLSLLKTLPKTTSGIPLKPCSFKANTQRLEEGRCTWYGACRFKGRDYMYQVRE